MKGRSMSNNTLAVRPETQRGFLTRFAAARPLTLFLSVVFTMEAAIMAWPVLAHYGVLPGGELPVPLFALATTVFVMFPTALWITKRVEGPGARRDYWSQIGRWRVPARWWLFVLLAAPLSTLIVGVVMGGSVNLDGLPDVVRAQAVSIVTAFLVINLWEEAVWVGFTQRVLQRRHRIGVAAILTAIPFTMVHLPLQLVQPSSSPARVLLGMVSLLGFAVVLRLFMALVYQHTGRSILLVGLLHSVFNASNNPGGLGDDLLSGANENYAAAIGIAILTVAFGGLSWLSYARQQSRR